MALDEALAEGVADGGAPVLRFYRWSPACLSLGRNQPARGLYDLEALRAAGIDVVRRPTGGRAVLHDHELTYSVAVRAGVLGTPRQSYAAINRALVAGLRRLGVRATLQPRGEGRAPPPSTVPCFREPVEGEVVVAGRKLVGSAQRRIGQTLLQHGSLLLSGDQSRTASFLLRAGFGGGSRDSGCLSDHLDPLPGWGALVAALAAGWADETGAAPAPDGPTARELAGADLLRRRYSDMAWTFHR